MTTDENAIKLQFIASMPDKYNYGAYRDFCVANNYELMNFVTYALMIEPVIPREYPAVTPRGNCGGCPGGAIR